VAIELHADGEAVVTTNEVYAILAEVDGLERRDCERVERRGRWTAEGDVRLEVTRSCSWGFGEAECAHSASNATGWHLRCRSLPPGAPEKAVARAANLACEFLEGTSEPRFTVAVGDRRELVAW
jgi:hypothetical protein